MLRLRLCFRELAGAIPFLRFPAKAAEQRFPGTDSEQNRRFQGSKWPFKAPKSTKSLRFDPNRKFGNAPSANVQLNISLTAIWYSVHAAKGHGLRNIGQR